ncbi:MAG: cysteine--tRNA ligase [Neisseriaceae bacterium]|nr:cysteine--tRNA ligase [Neisseriaceae bacterium]
MTLYLYNTLSKEKEPFIPHNPHKIQMYVCGMTVYDYCHLGHARVMVVFDMIARWLRELYGKDALSYVRNITDIDDKIIKRAADNGENISDLTARFITAMNEDAAALGVLPPDIEPKATEHIEQMIDMINRLIANGKAYPAANGDVYYRVREFAEYGRLSGKSLDDLRAGERVEVDSHKQDPLDFVLWKAAKPDEPFWESPWGKGRPGWHIECSAMGKTIFGETFDIHGGGADLQFPHHENEIAQSCGATNRTHSHVKYWLHNGFIRVDNEKMSKSLGNFFTIREVVDPNFKPEVKKFKPEVVRFFILRAHYRSPLNYSDAHLTDAKASLTRLYTALNNTPPADFHLSENANSYTQKFYAAMNDDFDTVNAIAVLFDLAREVNKTQDTNLSGCLKALGGLLGLLQQNPEEFFKASMSSNMASMSSNMASMSSNMSSGSSVSFDLFTIPNLSDEKINELIAERTIARKNKNWAESDRIRDELAGQGIILEDKAGETSWRRA